MSREVRPVSSHPHLELMSLLSLRKPLKRVVRQFIQYVPLRAHSVPNVKVSEAFYLKFMFGILLDFNAHKEDVPVLSFFFFFL